MSIVKCAVKSMSIEHSGSAHKPGMTCRCRIVGDGVDHTFCLPPFLIPGFQAGRTDILVEDKLLGATPAQPRLNEFEAGTLDILRSIKKTVEGLTDGEPQTLSKAEAWEAIKGEVEVMLVRHNRPCKDHHHIRLERHGVDEFAIELTVPPDQARHFSLGNLIVLLQRPPAHAAPSPEAAATNILEPSTQVLSQMELFHLAGITLQHAREVARLSESMQQPLTNELDTAAINFRSLAAKLSLMARKAPIGAGDKKLDL